MGRAQRAHPFMASVLRKYTRKGREKKRKNPPLKTMAKKEQKPKKQKSKIPTKAYNNTPFFSLPLPFPFPLSEGEEEEEEGRKVMMECRGEVMGIGWEGKELGPIVWPRLT